MTYIRDSGSSTKTIKTNKVGRIREENEDDTKKKNREEG